MPDHRLDTRLDVDALTSIPRDSMATFAFMMLDATQNLKGHEQLAGAAVLFAVLSRRFNKSPQDLHELGRRVIETEEAFHDKGNQMVETLKDFANGRVNSSPSF